MSKLLEFSKTDFFPQDVLSQRPGEAAMCESWRWLPGESVRVYSQAANTRSAPLWKSHAFFDSDLLQLPYFKNRSLHF